MLELEVSELEDHSRSADALVAVEDAGVQRSLTQPLTLDGSFSALWTATTARKDASFYIFEIYEICILLHSEIRTVQKDANLVDREKMQ